MAGFVSPIAIPVTNGSVRSFANMRIEFAGLSIPGGLGEVMRKRTTTREMVRSNNRDPVGKTTGESSYEATIQFYFDWYANAIATVRNNFGPGYGDVQFQIFLTYVGANLPVYFDVIDGCTWDTDEINAQKGTSALVVPVQLNPLKIYFAIPDGADYTDPIYDDNPDPLDTMT